MTCYRTIVADPPWDYGVARPGFTGLNTNPGRMLPYATMSVADIAALPVRDFAEKDAHLYLWTTQRFLTDAFTIAAAWGFKPSCVLVWCKEPMPFNYGGAFKSTIEFVLYCRRGSLKAVTDVDRQWFTWPRRKNSEKPEAFLDMVETVSPGPYLEMFARRNRLGWDTWGNEALEHVEMGA